MPVDAAVEAVLVDRLGRVRPDRRAARSSFGIGPICSTSHRGSTACCSSTLALVRSESSSRSCEVEVEDVFGFAGDTFHQYVLLLEQAGQLVELLGELSCPPSASILRAVLLPDRDSVANVGEATSGLDLALVFGVVELRGDLMHALRPCLDEFLALACAVGSGDSPFRFG